MNYASLQTAVATYLHRTDLTTNIPDFISLAEAFLFREIHVKELQVSVDGTTTDGYATLPSDFGSVSRVSITYSGAARTLDYISLADASTSTDAYPKYYSLENDKLRLWGTGTGQTYTLYYVPKIQALSISNTTNWLLEQAQDLYVYASALEGAKYIRDDQEAIKLKALVAEALDSVKRYTERRGQPSTGSLQIKPRR